MDSIESIYVTGPSNILFGSMYVCSFQSRNFTGRGSEGVNAVSVSEEVLAGTEIPGGGGRGRIYLTLQ